MRHALVHSSFSMMTSYNENIVRVTGPLWGESTGHRLIPLTKASDAELWCFLWSAPQQTVRQIIEAPVIWLLRHYNGKWLVTCSVPSRCPDECRIIVNGTPREISVNIESQYIVLWQEMHLKSSSAKDVTPKTPSYSNKGTLLVY